MDQPFLSVIVPVFNEERRIGDAIQQLVGHLSQKPYTWEIVVADDGSEDGSAAAVAEAAAGDERVRVVRLDHSGKGGAVRGGMLAARGQWRFMCDADLSMPVEQIDRFLPNDSAPDFDIGIGSREAPGSRRHSEPLARHLMGRAFNLTAQALAVRGLNDTQCGFKMYRGSLVPDLFGRQRLVGFGFDVELLFLARKAGARVEEIGIDWYYQSGSKMTLLRGARGFLDILLVRWNHLRGRYRADHGAEKTG